MGKRVSSEIPPADPGRPGPRRRRWRRWLKWAAIAYAVYAIVGFLVLPPIIKSQMLKLLPPIAKRQVAVDKVRLNPLALSFQLQGLSITETNGDVFASLGELYVNFQASSLFRWTWTFDELRLREPYGHVVLERDGRFNFENMIPEPDPESETEEASAVESEELMGNVPPVLIRHFHIQDAALEVDDWTHRIPLHAELKPINVSFTNLTTRVDEDAPYQIAVASDTFRQLAWTGELRFHPFDFHGKFIFEDGRLGRATPVVRDFARLEVIDGQVDAQLEFAVSLGPNGLSAVVTNTIVSLEDMKVKDLNSGLIVSSIGSLEVGPIDLSLQDRAFHVAAIRIETLSKLVQINEDGTINFNSLLELPQPQESASASPDLPLSTDESARPWTISLDELSVGKSVISFTDLSRGTPFQASLGPIDFQLTDFSTAPDQEARYSFHVTTDAGEHVSGSGIVSVLPTVRARGQVRLTDLDIPKYRPYYELFLNGEITSGRVHAGADFNVSLTTNGPSLNVTNAGFKLTRLRVKTLDPDETVLNLATLEVSDTHASLADQSVEVGAVRSDGARITVRQNADASINLLGLIPPTFSPQTGGSNQFNDSAEETEIALKTTPPRDLSHPPELPWDVIVREIDFRNYTIDLEDQKPAVPARILLAPLGFRFENVTLQTNAPIDFSFSTGVQGEGRVKVAGQAELFPPKADLTVEVDGLGLPLIQPYVAPLVAVTLADGRVRTRGRVVLEELQPEGGHGLPALSFDGDVGVTNFLTLDGARGQELVGWEDVSVRGIDVRTYPQSLRIGAIDVKGFHTSVIVDANGRTNVLSLFPPADTNAQRKAKAPVEPAIVSEKEHLPPALALPPVEVDAINLDRLSFRFLDQSVQPPCNVVMEELSGQLRGISTRPDTVIDVDLSGHVSRGAPFFVRGKVQPLAEEMAVNLAVTFTNTDLTPLTPYLEKYAGHPMYKGRLNMALTYDIRGMALRAENGFQVAQLTLGARNKSPDATALPVKLAVALLKDRRGNIELDVPLGGSLNDPEFSILPIVTKTVMNLILRAATSPFSLLGAVLGGDADGEELSFVTFDPGQSILSPAQTDKLDKLARALYERPEVNLEIKGEVDSVLDKNALAEAALVARVEAFERQETAVTNLTDEAAARFKEARSGSPSATLIAWPETEAGWLMAYYFRCAETNLSLLPETNLVLMLTGTNLLSETNLATGEFGDATGPETASVEEASQTVGSSGRRYYSFRKGATLLREPYSDRSSLNNPLPAARRRGGLFGRRGPPTPEGLALQLGLTDQAIRDRLVQAIEVPKETLRDLQEQRGKAVEQHLLGTEKVDRLRVFVVRPEQGREMDLGGQARAVFTLN